MHEVWKPLGMNQKQAYHMTSDLVRIHICISRAIHVKHGITDMFKAKKIQK